MSVKPAEILRVNGHDVGITRPEKVLFPEDGITKRDVIGYYERVSRWMLPHLKGRPVSMQRYPDGIDKPSFFQKAAAPYYPEWIPTVTVPKAGGSVRHVVCDDAATLVYLANQACLTPHVWLSRADKLRLPDQMIFDLDPSVEDVPALIRAAHALKELLVEIGLPPYVKATGSRGLHVVLPLERKEDFDSVRAIARQIAAMVVDRDPEAFTMEQSKNKRGGRVFIDTNRNAYAQTAAAPYALRARNGAPVAVPLHWSELRNKNFRPDGITLRTIFGRLEKTPDPWRDFRRHAVSLETARRKLEQMEDRDSA
jgi:bifunctional non-homologous end joining protein LigD